ncbi:hypothetical protein SDC9_114860 [bioreactor metagenome]|uniref:Uncharacterized protein n=1 Tax=bioreactor metagenome TaxID=1076179 RepID=A0A645BRI3_9ZZZZ
MADLTAQLFLLKKKVDGKYQTDKERAHAADHAAHKAHAAQHAANARIHQPLAQITQQLQRLGGQIGPLDVQTLKRRFKLRKTGFQRCEHFRKPGKKGLGLLGDGGHGLPQTGDDDEACKRQYSRYQRQRQHKGHGAAQLCGALVGAHPPFHRPHGHVENKRHGAAQQKGRDERNHRPQRPAQQRQVLQAPVPRQHGKGRGGHRPHRFLMKLHFFSF